ncbi:MAG TPA: tetratricopeptide repeat protein [Terracidiphilus sp.]|jgi:tol-pal system protein YbgF
MQITQKLRNRFLTVAVLAVVLVSVPIPAHATSKEMIELQTQVQQLLDMVQRLQSTLDGRFGVIQHLVEQTADNANQMTVIVNALQLKVNAQSEANNGKLDTVSGQVQSLNDSVDELKSRIAKLDKSVHDLQAQLQNIQSAPAGAAPAIQNPDQNAQPADAGAPSAPAAPSANVAPPLQETFQAGLRDYNSAHYDVAAGEFQEVLQYYPLDDLAGQAQFYLGEIAYRQLNYADAIKSFNAVLEGFPGSPKAPAAQLRKGLALLQMNKRDSGIHELRLLIQRHPQTPEAGQARTKLNGLGVHITPTPAH